MSSITYQSLEGPSEIRVLTLRHGNDDEPITCTLRHITLNAPISDYNALSYTWGDPNALADIFIGGQEIKVTRTLKSALRRIRSVDHDITLWVDAVCINQEDLEEKGQQIPLMGKIYQIARTTIVDIGESDTDSEVVLKIWRGMQRFVEKYKECTWRDQMDLASCNLPPEENEDWEAWNRLLARPWFRRAWIVQEFALSTEVRWLYGKEVIRGLSLPYLIGRMALLGYVSPNRIGLTGVTATKGLQALVHMNDMRDAILTGSKLPLFEILKLGRSAEATNLRDKVYAFLSLCSDAKALGVPINYDHHIVEVYLEVARAIVKKYNNIDILYEANNQSSTFTFAMYGLPSWVPDWSRNLRQGTELTDGAAERKRVCASGSSESRMRVVEDSTGRFIIGEIQACKLSVTGCIIDEVRKTEYCYIPRRDDPWWTAERKTDKALSVVAKARKAMAKLQTYPTGENTTKVLINTLLMVSPSSSMSDYLDEHYSEMLQHVFDRNRVSPRKIVTILESYEAFVRYGELSEALNTWWDVVLFGWKHLYTLVRPWLWTTPLPVQPGLDEAYEMSATFRRAITRTMWERRFATTVNGYVGMLPWETRTGDMVCIINGSTVPFIVRKSGNEYTLVGSCYIYGVMDGEAYDSKKFEEEEIILY